MLMKKCRTIITDSGGIQEEATAPPIRKPVLVARLFTERPEAVDAGFAKVVGVARKSILASINRTLRKQAILPEISPFGEGNAGKRIVNILASLLTPKPKIRE